MFYSGSVDKEFACDAGDTSSIPGLGRYPGEGNGNSHQYSCLKNPMDRGAWWATVLGGRKESDMTVHTPMGVTAVILHFADRSLFQHCVYYKYKVFLKNAW